MRCRTLSLATWDESWGPYLRRSRAFFMPHRFLPPDRPAGWVFPAATWAGVPPCNLSIARRRNDCSRSSPRAVVGARPAAPPRSSPGFGGPARPEKKK